MANWALPTLSSLYADFLAEVSGRLDDSATMFLTAPSNQPVGSIRFVRASNIFQEWTGSAYVDKVIGVTGGGTGATSATGARTALGLGTLAVQNSSAINVTGGGLTGITTLGLTGDLTFTTDNTSKIGTNTNRAGIVYIRSGLVVPVGVDKFVSA